MSELARKGPLSGLKAISAGAYEIAPREGIAACLVTSRRPIDLPGAIRISPGELLLLEDGADASALAARIAESVNGQALVQDMTPALAFITLDGPQPLDFLGIGALCFTDSTVTRLADLRVTLVRRNTGVLLVAERFSAAYLWEWLLQRLEIPLAG